MVDIFEKLIRKTGSVNGSTVQCGWAHGPFKKKRLVPFFLSYISVVPKLVGKK